MPSTFVLRGEGDESNPFLPRLYGLGITTGKNILYQSVNSRITFMSILAQGARFVGDLGCSKAIKVYYQGFELSEFDSTGARNWKFHKGTIAAAPQYIPIANNINGQTVTTTTPHGYATGDAIAFHKRGADVLVPVSIYGQMPMRQKFIITVTGANTFKVHNQDTGAPVAGNELTFGAVTNFARLFVWKANAHIFDPVQGRPEFFGTVDFTFSGYCYIEVRLPVNALFEGEDEPSGLKVLMEGKEVKVIASVAGNVSFSSTVTAEVNNANVAADVLVHDGKVPLSRLHGDSWVAWRDRCDGTLQWVGGNENPAQLPSYTLIDAAYDVALNKLTETNPIYAIGHFGYAFTHELTSDYPSIEFKYMATGYGMGCAFCSSPSLSTPRQGVFIQYGQLYYWTATTGPPTGLYDWGTMVQVVPCAVGDVIRITYENGLLKIYLNSVPCPLVSTGQLQQFQTYYGMFQLNVDESPQGMKVAPSGTAGIPRIVKRFEGAFAAAQPLPAADVFEAQMHLSAGCSWADIDGQIRIATEPDRTPCHTFIYDPTNVNSQSNVHKIAVKRKPSAETPNYYRYTFRDKDDPILSRKPSPIDRKERRTQQGGKLIDAGLLPYGVMTQSHIERIGETRARLETDLDTGFTVEAFADSCHVVKGSFVNVVAPETGYTAAAPALCHVIEARLSTTDVETIVYELQITTTDWYSDTAHGPVTPVRGGSVNNNFIPPPAATSLDVSETTEPMPDGTYVSSISGQVQFGDAINQHGRVFQKPLTAKFYDITYDSGTNLFTIPADLPMPAASEQLSLGSTSNSYPAGYSHDVPYYRVNVSGQTFKLSLYDGGTAEIFTSNGANLGLYEYAEWQDTGIDIIPQ